jgi:XTP/dITP diphosphohydrolase
LRYVCVVAFVEPGAEPRTVTGTCSGRMAAAPRGDGGFGYDPIAIPVEGDGRTFAEMSPAEKHGISHRSRAFQALLPLLDR